MICQSNLPYGSYTFVHETFIMENSVRAQEVVRYVLLACGLDSDIYDEEYNDKKYSRLSKHFPDI